MADSDDEFVLSEVIAEAQGFIVGEIAYDCSRIIWLIDALLIAAYDDPSETILEPALQLCDLVIEKKQRLCQVHIRKAQVFFHQGSFILSRQTLDQAEELASNEKLELEVNEFRKELQTKVTRDGKIAIFILGGAISALTFWWLGRNKALRAAERANLESTNSLEYDNNNNNNGGHNNTSNNDQLKEDW